MSSKNAAPSLRNAVVKRRYNKQDVLTALAYSPGDTAALQSVRQMSPTRETTLACIDFLRTTGRPTTVLETYYRERGWPVSAGRPGRPPPTVGDERFYKAQQFARRESFIRLPLRVLGIERGQLVRVEFTRERICVFPHPAR